jgi:hypothetical protein
MSRKAAWAAELTCVGCDHRTRYRAAALRKCPECGGFLRMELRRRPEPDTRPEPVVHRRRSNRSGREENDARPLRQLGIGRA